MKKLVLLGVMLLSACGFLWGYGVEPLFIRDGIQVYRSSCSGNFRDIGDCYALASKQCNGRFEVVNSLDDNLGTVYNRFDNKTTMYGDDTRNEINGGIATKSGMRTRALFFYCKE